MATVLPSFDRLRRAAMALCRVEIWIVGGTAAASILLPRFLPAAVFTAAVFFVLRRLAVGRASVRTRADLPIVALLALSGASLLVSALPEITRVQMLRLWSGIGLFYAIINWTDREARLKQLVQIGLAGGALLALAAPFSVEWPAEKLPFLLANLYARFRLLAVDTIHPNVIGGILAILLPLAAAMLLFDRQAGRPEKVWAASAAALMGVVLAITLSRGALMAVSAAGIGLLILRGKWGWLVLAAAGLLMGFLLYRLGADRLMEILFSGGAISSLDGRMEIWSRAGMIIRDFPFSGIGMGAFQPIVDRIYPLASYQPGSIYHAHNLYLQLAVDLGLPGLLAWLAVLAVGLTAAWRIFSAGRAQANGFLQALGAGLLCSQIALCVHGLTDAVVWGMVRPAPVVWMLWGLAVAGFRVATSIANRPLPGSAVDSAADPEC